MKYARPNVILHGGPPSLLATERIRYVENTDDKVKLLRENHYDHFEPTTRIEQFFGWELRVFIWTGITRVAE